MITLISKLGYLSLALLCLSSLALVVITTLQYTVFNQSPGTQPGVLEVENITRNVYMPLPTSPVERLPSLDAPAWLFLIVTVILLINYTGGVGSTLLKTATKRIFRKLTNGNLFIAKLVLIGLLFMHLSLIALLLPAAKLIMPVMTVFALLAYICFGIQFYIVRRNKVSIKDVL